MVTPQQSSVHGDSSTPSSAEDSGPIRFRNLDEIYDETSEIELMDSDVEALLVETGEPIGYAEAVGHQEWVEAMDR